eukprot:CAMPEP_0115850678 /NCGR_PEP_ID=MMETSP0287-20121206/12091_1 /TAXON_ID=412157 /ORGANISM="Chrysochromulina rotalis, Strain UIO044" /LENGTH=79 /DNA_ID=CAMNT_0003304689 /DNA_START=132 /DNA_END=372 /DNA_ORIENTATION=-
MERRRGAHRVRSAQNQKAEEACIALQREGLWMVESKLPVPSVDAEAMKTLVAAEAVVLAPAIGVMEGVSHFPQEQACLR